MSTCKVEDCQLKTPQGHARAVWALRKTPLQLGYIPRGCSDEVCFSQDGMFPDCAPAEPVLGIACRCPGKHVGGGIAETPDDEYVGASLMFDHTCWRRLYIGRRTQRGTAAAATAQQKDSCHEITLDEQTLLFHIFGDSRRTLHTLEIANVRLDVLQPCTFACKGVDTLRLIDTDVRGPYALELLKSMFAAMNGGPGSLEIVYTKRHGSATTLQALDRWPANVPLRTVAVRASSACVLCPLTAALRASRKLLETLVIHQPTRTPCTSHNTRTRRKRKRKIGTDDEDDDVAEEEEEEEEDLVGAPVQALELLGICERLSMLALDGWMFGQALRHSLVARVVVPHLERLTLFEASGLRLVTPSRLHAELHAILTGAAAETGARPKHVEMGAYDPTLAHQARKTRPRLARVLAAGSAGAVAAVDETDAPALTLDWLSLLRINCRQPTADAVALVRAALETAGECVEIVGLSLGQVPYRLRRQQSGASTESSHPAVAIRVRWTSRTTGICASFEMPVSAPDPWNVGDIVEAFAGNSATFPSLAWTPAAAARTTTRTRQLSVGPGCAWHENDNLAALLHCAARCPNFTAYENSFATLTTAQGAALLTTLLTLTRMETLHLDSAPGFLGSVSLATSNALLTLSRPSLHTLGGCSELAWGDGKDWMEVNLYLLRTDVPSVGAHYLARNAALFHSAVEFVATDQMPAECIEYGVWQRTAMVAETLARLQRSDFVQAVGEKFDGDGFAKCLAFCAALDGETYAYNNNSVINKDCLG